MEKYLGLVPVILLILFYGIKHWWKYSNDKINWESHREMTANKSEIYGDGTYEDFIREFNKYDEWRKSELNNYSLFHKEYLNDSYYLHAGIFKFNNVGMRMKTLKDYKKVMKWIEFYVDEEKDIYDWSNNRLLKPKQEV